MLTLSLTLSLALSHTLSHTHKHTLSLSGDLVLPDAGSTFDLVPGKSSPKRATSPKGVLSPKGAVRPTTPNRNRASPKQGRPPLHLSFSGSSANGVVVVASGSPASAKASMHASSADRGGAGNAGLWSGQAPLAVPKAGKKVKVDSICGVKIPSKINVRCRSSLACKVCVEEQGEAAQK